MIRSDVLDSIGEYATANDDSDCSEKLALQDKVAPTLPLAEIPSRVDTWMAHPSSFIGSRTHDIAV